MKKIFCDICGKEIVNSNKTWKQELVANENNKRVSYNESLIDVCEYCATIIHCCTFMMKKCGWKPDFHEVLESDSVFEREKAGYELSKLEDLYSGQ